MTSEITIRGEVYSRDYNDCALSENPKVEEAFRQAYLTAAEEVANWNFPDLNSIETAWEERVRVKQRAEKWVSAKEYFGDPEFDDPDAMCRVFRCGHEIEAARTRGRVHAFAFAVEAWQRFVAIGFSNEEVHQEFMRPWPEVVREWAALPINEFECPPKPDEVFTLQQWQLILSKLSGEKKVFASMYKLEDYLNSRYGHTPYKWNCFSRERDHLGRAFLWRDRPGRITVRFAVREGTQWVLFEKSSHASTLRK